MQVNSIVIIFSKLHLIFLILRTHLLILRGYFLLYALTISGELKGLHGVQRIKATPVVCKTNTLFNKENVELERSHDKTCFEIF